MTSATSPSPATIAVVIPSYRVKQHILGVLAGVGPEVSRIYVIDDCCPEQSGDYVERHNRDPRVVVIRHDVNQGVGGAVMTGYQAAATDGMTVIVKIDGDGQMDPALIGRFVRPILDDEADYTKGNRFFDLRAVRSMPPVRLLGNAILSFFNKLSSGYWDIFDPTNGYTAIHANVVRHLPLERISRRYFFETDILFRLNTLRAVVQDIPMEARYGTEVSNLHIHRVLFEFLGKHLRNLCKRIGYNYYLRDLSVASLELPLGIALIAFGTVYGGAKWIESAAASSITPAGTVMLAALPIMLGIQFLLAFVGHDVASRPVRSIARSLRSPALRDPKQPSPGGAGTNTATLPVHPGKTP